MSPNHSLYGQASAFADELTLLLSRSLPDAPAAIASISGDRVVVQPEHPVHLYIGGAKRATLGVRFRCELDSRGDWLAVENSSFDLRADVDRTPVLRFEYIRQANRAPAAHVQVHAHRGALSLLLAQANHHKAHDMSALHIPVGGARFRPCIEDVIQMLAEEFGFDTLGTWRQAVAEGRESWRRKQVRAVVRDWQSEAADVLGSLGYTVTPPHPEGVDVPTDARTRW